MAETNPQAEVVTTEPQAEVSIEDRILNAMGENTEETPQTEAPVEQETETEAVEDSQEQPAEAEPEYVERDIQGNVYQLPPELIEIVDKGLDATRKWGEAAELKRSAEAEKQAIAAEKQAFQQQVQAQQQNFQLHAEVAAIDGQIAQYANIDWARLEDDDPLQAMKLDRSLRELKETRNDLVQKAIVQQQELAQAQQLNTAKSVEENVAILKRDIPNWNGELYNSLLEYVVKDFGYTPQEAATAVDARAWKLAHKAYQYDQLVKSKPTALNKVSIAPKIIKQGAQQPSQSNEQVLRKIIKTSTDRNAKNTAIQRLLEAKLK
jgi:hypothetical protein